MKIIKATDYQDLSRKAANIVSAQVILYPNSVLGLATGSTPLGVYRQLIEWYNKSDVDFSETRTVNLDEYRGLPREDKNSYYYYMYNNFFKYINIDMANVNIPNGMASDVDEECRRYDDVIKRLGGVDLQILGIGSNGHIGFNEPNIEFEKQTHCVDLTAKTRQANARFFNSIDDVPKQAITMGIKSIMQSKKILLLSSGEAKSEIIRRALFGPITPSVPASILQLHPNLTVVSDNDTI